MNGARALLSTLVDAGVDVCFANPGTSEMHFVAALDDVPDMRGVLCLFEGVVTGAADGYGRVAGRPAATLLHLGPGLGNGLANLHNARRARTPIVNIVGDHATYHARYDAPLQSEIASIAGPVSGWYRTHGARRRRGAPTRRMPFPPRLVPPAVWPPWSCRRTHRGRSRAPAPCPPRPRGRSSLVPGDTVDEVAKALRSGERAALLLGGSALRAGGLQAASRVATTSGAALLGETFPANLERGRASRRSTAWLTWQKWPRPSSTGSGTSSWSTPNPRCPSSPTPARRATLSRPAAPCTPWPGRARTQPVHSRRWPTRWAHRAMAACPRLSADPIGRPVP